MILSDDVENLRYSNLGDVITKSGVLKINVGDIRKGWRVEERDEFIQILKDLSCGPPAFQMVQCYRRTETIQLHWSVFQF